MIPSWLHDLSIANLLFGAIAALSVFVDVIRHPQQMRIMNVVWPVLGLFASVVALVGARRRYACFLTAFFPFPFPWLRGSRCCLEPEKGSSSIGFPPDDAQSGHKSRNVSSPPMPAARPRGKPENLLATTMVENSAAMSEKVGDGVRCTLPGWTRA